MARAYKKTYLNGAMRNLAVMMDCGVRKYGYPIEEFYDKFLSCEVSRQFAAGNHAISWVCQGLSWPTVWWRLPVELS